MLFRQHPAEDAYLARGHRPAHQIRIIMILSLSHYPSVECKRLRIYSLAYIYIYIYTHNKCSSTPKSARHDKNVEQEDKTVRWNEVLLIVSRPKAIIRQDRKVDMKTLRIYVSSCRARCQRIRQCRCACMREVHYVENDLGHAALKVRQVKLTFMAALRCYFRSFVKQCVAGS